MGLLGRLLGSDDGDDNRDRSARMSEKCKTMSAEERRSVRNMDAALLKLAEKAERRGDMKRAQELRRSIGD